jgi:hypothetical protein
MRGDAARAQTTEAAMNELLAARYRALFLSYDNGGNLFVANLRERIARELMPRGRLRPDAALFLLLTFDRMLLRPYLGAVVEPGGSAPMPPAIPPDGSGAFLGRIEDSVGMVLARSAELRAGGEISAHAVMQAIDGLWPRLAELFDWS